MEMKFYKNLCQRLIGVMILFTSALSATAQINYDSLEISLLTCSPHQEIYSLYGHTAIRCQDKATGEDLVVNYGMFDFNQPYFVLRFVFGLTDYSMGISSFNDFIRAYRYYKSSVTQQQLNLTAHEKASIMQAIAENARPENLVYRYNYFYDNCTTRARDMLTNHLDGEVRYTQPIDSAATFRSMMHSCVEEHPWARFGNDLLLGLQADRPTTRSDQQFLPAHLQNDFSHAVIVSGDSTRQLVKSESVIEPGGIQVVEEEFPVRPSTCAWIILVVTIVIIFLEFLLHRNFWIFDLLLMLCCGLAGIVLTLMIFSQHPTVRINLQILLFNPILLFLTYSVVKKSIQKRLHWWWSTWAVLLVLFLIFGVIFQHYAEGMNILALSLLIRYISRVLLFKRLAAFRV